MNYFPAIVHQVMDHIYGLDAPKPSAVFVYMGYVGFVQKFITWWLSSSSMVVGFYRCITVFCDYH